MNKNINIVVGSGTPDIQVQLSPYNEKEDDTSEPKLNISMRPSIYTDIVFVSVMSDYHPDESMVDFKFQLMKDGNFTIMATDGDKEEFLYENNIERLKQGHV